MLKVFSRGGPAHALADAKERSRLLREISALEAHRALGELVRLLDLNAGDDGLKPEVKADTVHAVDAAGYVPAQLLANEYLSTARLSKSQESRVWESMHGFCAAVARAYLACLDAVAPNVQAAAARKSLAVPLSVHALRALGRQLKWEHMRYGPVDREIWASLGRVYERIEAARIARLAMREWPESTTRTSAEKEFVRITMFSVCSPGSLLPAQIEIADRLTARFAGSFRISRRRGSATPYRVDLAQGSPPARCVGPVLDGPSARFFGAEAAYRALLALRNEIALLGEAPEDIAPTGPQQGDKVLEVIDHLAPYWAPRVTGRRHLRHGIKSRLTVTWGFDGVLDALDPLASRCGEKRAMESWIVENASAGGVGALMAAIPGEWLRVGCLVAMRPEGGTNWLLGTVKRLRRTDESRAQVGIQTLARSPTAVEFRIQVGDETALRAETGVLLDPGYTEAEVPVLLRTRASESGRTLVLERDGRRTQLIPMAVTARGPDYEVVRCRQLVRSEG
jgi:hypothetical protein